MTNLSEINGSSCEPETERTSAYESPQWRRRTVSIDIKEAGPLRLEVVIVSRRWAPHSALRRVVASMPGYWLERFLRRVAGRKIYQTIVFRRGSIRQPSALVIGDEVIAPDSVEAVALQGWQEDFGRDRLWDIMLIGPDHDVVVGHKSFDEAHELATKLAEVLGVPLKESSVVGGSTTPLNATIRRSF